MSTSTTGGFAVDVDALADAARGVAGTLNELSTNPLSNLPTDPVVIGDADLAATLADFADRWQRGVTNLATDAHAIAAGLVTNAARYQRVERDLTAHAHRVGDELIGTGADPGTVG